jgi:exocyst complex component 2
MAAESALLNHYKIDSLNPAEWPVEKDLEDSSDEEVIPLTSKHSRKVSRSRYSVLESPRRTSVPGAERTKDGIENLVQKDEPDPLGSSGSVIQSLRRQGLKIEDDSKIRMNLTNPRGILS